MKSRLHSSPFEHLPIKRNPTLAYMLSIIIALLMAAASLGGLLFPSSIYPYTIYLIGMPYGPLTLVFATLVLLTAFLMFVLLRSIDGDTLIQRISLGYASGLGLLFAASTLILGAMLILLLQPVLTNAPFALDGVIILAGMGLVCFIPTGLFLRGVVSKGKML